MDDAIVIRQSTMNQLGMCPARVALAPERRPPSEPLLFGTVVHAFVEADLRGKQLMPADGNILNVLETELADGDYTASSLEELADDSRLERFCEEVREAIILWPDVKTRLNLVGDLMIEETIKVQIEHRTCQGRPIVFQGTPDLIVNRTAIYDWKTAGRMWADNKHATQVQPAFYGLLAKLAFGFDITEWHYVIYDRSKKQWGEQQSPIYQARMHAVKQNALFYAEMLEHEVFPYQPSDMSNPSGKRSWYCSQKYCDAWDVCEGRKLVADAHTLLEGEIANGQHDFGW